MVGASTFAIPFSNKTLDVDYTYWYTSRTHISGYSESGNLEGRFLSYFYNSLSISAVQPSQPHDKAAKYLWKVTSLLKVKIITWLAICDRLPTGLYLHRHHIRLLSLCVFCDNQLESSAHIFFHVPLSWESGPLLWLVWLFHHGSFLFEMWEDWRTSCITGAFWKILDIRVQAVLWSI